MHEPTTATLTNSENKQAQKDQGSWEARDHKVPAQEVQGQNLHQTIHNVGDGRVEHALLHQLSPKLFIVLKQRAGLGDLAVSRARREGFQELLGPLGAGVELMKGLGAIRANEVRNHLATRVPAQVNTELVRGG